MTLNQRIDFFTSIMMYKTIINLALTIYIIGLSMLKINTKSTQDQPQVETCSYLSYLLRQDKDLSSTGEYMLGTVYLWTLETI